MLKLGALVAGAALLTALSGVALAGRGLDEGPVVGADPSARGAAKPGKSGFACVNPDGTVARGKNVLDAQRVEEPAGVYRVRFNSNITRCVYTATIGRCDPFGTEDPGEITADRQSTSATSVFVTTNDSSGALADRAFMLVVTCP
jgi:hypothetical protein